ncbi:unnamed protein product [Mytilus coruscus]|uniref:Uncharacterized protein n=1 Tax=Mytilus coruscus TaxID=42192 RepID=A0A6J8F058_MYTCO|nr:unnamed protein product [Mytilus coruscus]
MVTTFHEGKYTDDVREVYATLLSMNVGVKNIENVIKTVLEKLGGLKVERLPKKTFAEYMMVEAKALAQIQAAEAMLNSNFNTLHTDGTKRMGREFGGLQVGTDSGQLSLGISELVSGNTESFLKMIDQILSDMGSLLETDEDIAVKKAKLLLSVKNLMTDRHIVNTCLKNCLEKMRFECVPEDGDTPEEVRTKVAKLNGFKCNLHVIVNFASQAEIGLKQWEKNISNLDNVEDNNVNFTYNQSTTDFIRACCKLCVPGADEKSGYGSLFRTFLSDNNIDLKLTTFHGHRINLLFAMGASVFFHKDNIYEFIDLYFEKENRNNLLKAVANYVKNPMYLAGCRAFGIVDKLFTGPLWRIIENADHILDLNQVWEQFKGFLEIYSQDATDLVEGKILYKNYTNIDEIFGCLFAVEDEELNILTTEALQIILLNFQLILERQLSDCLPGGILNEKTDGIDINLREQSKSVATTNIISERDFANLDRLQREKPNANLIALEVNLTQNEKIEAVKTQLKFRKKVLHMNVEDKTLLQFSSNTISFSLAELISNLKVLIHLNINVDNAQSGTKDTCIIFCIKSKEEREQIMEKQRELICIKLNEIKIKQNPPPVCEPVQKKPRKSNSNKSNYQSQNHDNVEETDFVVSKPSETYTPKSIALKAGQYIAVAYIDTWYPGQILSVKNDLLVQVKFLCPSQNMGNLFKWTQKDDISVVENIFIFCSDFEVKAKDSGGRTRVLTNYDTICSEYKKYYNTYFV